MANRYVPLSRLVDVWPDAAFELPDLGSLAVVDTEAILSGGVVVATYTIELGDAVVFTLPGIDLLELRVLSAGSSAEIGVSLELSDNPELTLSSLDVTLRIKGGLLRPVTPGADGGWDTVDADEDGVADPVDITFDPGAVTVTLDGNIAFSSVPTLVLPAVMLGETGVVIEASDVKIYLAPGENWPPSQSPDFRGVVLDSVTVHLPDSLSVAGLETISCTNFVIGNGGFSGRITGTWSPTWTDTIPSGDGSGTLAGFGFGLELVAVEFSQNALVMAQLSGKIALPFFDQVVSVDIGIDQSGGLVLSLADADDDGLLELTVPNVGTLRVSSLAVEIEDGVAAVVLQGSIILTLGSPGIQWPEVELDGLRVDTNGRVQINGGWLTLPTPLALALGGFQVELSQVGFGNTEDGRRWVGFSGGVTLTAGLPTGASVEGLRVIWDPATGGEPEVTLNGVGIQFTIPNALEFEGRASYYDEGTEKFFRGDLSARIVPLEVAIDGGVLVGQNTDSDPFNYLYLYLGVELPVGIPLGSTGAALYGFSGMFGVNVRPARDEDDWYLWYSEQSPAFDVQSSLKWGSERDAYAIGAGMTVGTVFDTGYSVSAKALLALLMPGPVVMLHGMANILQVKPELEGASEGTLNMLSVLDGNAGTFQMNIDAGWGVPKIVDVEAAAEAFFDFARPAEWHVWIGKDTPESERVRADVLALLHADTYLMLDAAGARQGFGVTLGQSWEFGPVALTLRAWMSAQAELSWRPAHVSGSIGMGGEFELAVAGFSLGVSVEANLSGESPTIYSVGGELTVRVDLPTPLHDFERTIDFYWEEPAEPEAANPIEAVSVEHLVVADTWPLTLESSATAFDPVSSDEIPIVPLDARPMLVFNKSMKDSAGVGRDGADYAGPEQVGEYDFTYELVSVALERWPLAFRTAGASAAWEALDEEPWGTWAATDDGSGGTAAATRLQLFVRTPFAFARQSTRAYADRFLGTHTDWPCGASPVSTNHLVDWETIPTGTTYPGAFDHQLLSFLFVGSVTPAVEAYAFALLATAHALRWTTPAAGSMWIAFPERVARVRLWGAVANGGAAVTLQATSEGNVVFDQLLSPGWSGEVAIDVPDVEWLSLTWPSETTFRLVRISYVTQAEADEFDWQTERRERLESQAEVWSSDDEVLEPETSYRLTITARATRTHPEDGDVVDTWTRYAFFRTLGAPGVHPEELRPSWVADQADVDPRGADPAPIGGRLVDLAPLTQRVIPEDGALAAFRAYDIGVEFSENYVEQLYGSDLVVELLDDNGEPVLDETGAPVEFANAWGRTATQELGETEYQYTTAYEDCGTTSLSELTTTDQVVRAGTATLLDDDFTGGLTGWVAQDDGTTGGPSAWAAGTGLVQTAAIGDGSTSATAIEKLGTMLLAGDADWADLSFETEVASGSGAVGLVFRHAGVGDYYRLSLDTTFGYRRLVRVSGGVFTELWSDTTAYTPGATMALLVQVQGTRIRAQVNEELLFDLTDDDASAPTAGQVGVYTWGTSTAVFSRALARPWPESLLSARRRYSARLMGSIVVYADGFTSWPRGWLTVDVGSSGGMSTWSISGGQLLQTAGISSGGSQGIGTVVLVGRAEWRGVRVEVNLSSAGASGTVGFVVQWTDATHWTAVGVDLVNQQASIYTRSGGSPVVHATGSVSIAAAQQVAARVVRDEDGVRLEIDGAEVVATTAVPGLTGPIGLFTDDDDGVAFSDLVVRSEPRLEALRWTFSTSAYAGWVELVDAFAGVHSLDVTDPGAALGTTLGTAATDRATAITALDAARSALALADAGGVAAAREAALAACADVDEVCEATYDAVATLLELPYLPTPPALELVELTSAAGRHGLLLCAPEPIEVERVDTALRVASSTAGPYTSASDLLAFWNADRTRVLLFRGAGGGFDAGAYQLDLVWRLDVGAERAALRRGGSSLPEIARIEFELA